jgi:hypothetical protein
LARPRGGVYITPRSGSLLGENSRDHCLAPSFPKTASRVLSNYSLKKSHLDINMRHRVSQNCTEVTPQCLVENTIYGYAPNLGLNAFFVAIFSICALAQIYLGTKYKTFFFAYVITLGAIGEAIGYGGRIIMHSNPVCTPAIDLL